jgi:hypothetical protein
VDVADGEEEPFKYDGELNLLLSDWYHESIYNQMVGLSSSPMRWIGEPQVNLRLLISKYKSQKWFHNRSDLQSEPAKSAVSSKIQNTENISLSTSIQIWHWQFVAHPSDLADPCKTTRFLFSSGILNWNHARKVQLTGELGALHLINFLGFENEYTTFLI